MVTLTHEILNDQLLIQTSTFSGTYAEKNSRHSLPENNTATKGLGEQSEGYICKREGPALRSFSD